MRTNASNGRLNCMTCHSFDVMFDMNKILDIVHFLCLYTVKGSPVAGLH